MGGFLNYVPPEYVKYSAMYPRQEVIHGAIWDTQPYLTGVTLQLQFFVGLAATPDLSNMEAAGQLPPPNAMLVRAIRFKLKDLPESVATAAAGAPQPGAVDNHALLGNNGWLDLTIGQKLYAQLPIWAVPEGGGASGQILTEDVLIAGAYTDAAGGGLPHAKNVWTLARPIFIPPGLNFTVVTTWAAVNAITRNTNVCVLLEGDLIRPVQ